MGVNRPLTLLQNNDVTVAFTVTDEDTKAPFDLTGATAIELYLKPMAATADTDPGVHKLTLALGDITVTDAPAGECAAAILATMLATAGRQWYRLDVVGAGKRRTPIYGILSVTDT